jgi:hypothetical protein
MTIRKEGTITITPDSRIEATGFEIEGGTLADLQALVEQRVARAAYYLVCLQGPDVVVLQMTDNKEI